MRLTGQGRVHLTGGEEVFRQPGMWDKVKFFFGSDVDLRTGELQLTRDVLRLTEQIQKGLLAAGIDNAVSLVVDTDVIYADDADRKNDADLLVAAMRSAHGRFVAGFETLRAVFEHEGDGLHTLIEVTVRAKHEKAQPAATIAVGGRILELRPQAGESIEDAKDRIGKRLGDDKLVPTYKQLLGDFCERIRGGLQRSFPDGRVEMDPPDLQVVKPSADEVRELGTNRDQRRASLRSAPSYPRSGYYGAHYDPWGTYYRDPMDTFVNLMVIDAMISPRSHWGYSSGHLGSSWSHYGSPVHIMDYNGSPICDADQMMDYSTRFDGVTDVVDLDFDAAVWDDSAMDIYTPEETSWDGYGGDSGGGSFDCAGYEDTSESSSFDCSSDCSWDCSSDCSWDCSSDCSFDCSSDCSDW
ncbi:MAG: hypothetical protein KC502_15270 [Myxococcales bacterium]|nr:hypothetical protein [Myxococcales bacterium]